MIALCDAYGGLCLGEGRGKYGARGAVGPDGTAAGGHDGDAVTALDVGDGSRRDIADAALEGGAPLVARAGGPQPAYDLIVYLCSPTALPGVRRAAATLDTGDRVEVHGLPEGALL